MNTPVNLTPETLPAWRDGAARALFVRLNLDETDPARFFPESHLFLYGNAGRLGTLILARLIALVCESHGCMVRSSGASGSFNRALIFVSLGSGSVPVPQIVAELAGLQLAHAATIAEHDPREDVWRVYHPPGGTFTDPGAEIELERQLIAEQAAQLNAVAALLRQSAHASTTGKSPSTM